jgi:hypothetical protein
MKGGMIKSGSQRTRGQRLAEEDSLIDSARVNE